ncbi:uncharacterized protein LOC125759501 [Rhipicephalus sanguineus]|uniref:uncharacterized protein LOC125759501 n=1 Tax=Rhipicephalus sanguineus TaxID=34632 RepID=UPI0020C3504D|nr:uncharacterized protein LOC125759501 [Rhipicephalus sanguineus]
MLVCNPFQHPVTLLRGESLGRVDPVDPFHIIETSDDTPCYELDALTSPVKRTSASSSTSPSSDILESVLDADLPPPYRMQVLELLQNFRSSFDCDQTRWGRTENVSHSVHTGSHPPLRQRPYRVSAAEHFPTHLVRLREILTCLTTAGLQLNIKKCRFAARKLTILGHVVSKDGVLPDPAKLRAVAEFPKPTTLKALRSFVGLCSYFRRFVRSIGHSF